MKKKSDFRQIKKNNKEEKNKVIILSGFSDEQLHNFIDNYKKTKLPKAIFATVTETSKEFKIKNLLRELKKEKRMMKNFRNKSS